MALLEVKNLGISFGGLRAVDQFEINIKKGQLYGLIGPNGAGKTTIFNMLTGVYKPTDGIIKLDGEDLVGKKTIEINKAGIARTFQNIRLFSQQSVLDNVKIGLRQNRAIWLQRAHCSERSVIIMENSVRRAVPSTPVWCCTRRAVCR